MVEIQADTILPLFDLAEEEAKKSPCIRGKYGALLAYSGDDFRYCIAHNERVSQRCCPKGACMRDRLCLMNGERTEVGAEIHAEVALLIRTGPRERGTYFILTGFGRKGRPLYGKNVYPCHGCAIALKFAGFDYIYIRTSANSIEAVNVNEIILEREEEWQTQSQI